MPATIEADAVIQCDVLILITTPSEEKELKRAVRDAGLPWDKKTHARLGQYWSIGLIGDNRVNVVRTEGMGPLGYGGSAAKAMEFRVATGAQALIQLGMAFGIYPGIQNKGDVLVSSALIPYDNRDVRSKSTDQADVLPLPIGLAEAEHGETADSSQEAIEPVDPLADESQPANPAAAKDGYFVDYKSRVVWQPASPVLLRMLAMERLNPEYDHQFFEGGMLSGGARVFSSAFLRELVEGVPAVGDIIGGDMEGVGLLASSPPDHPAWVVVKGISDFADDERSAGPDPAARTLACRNSARYVVKALSRAKVV